ncbi:MULTISPECIES: regulatory protein RecX [unclassified Gordonia (in: high G+C Gram-positive bacteria)]|uniref:regulatory protein RecX n=1 Tax=unclassified Gordonia (in: high G+C Gram-positive bacteria) TaxID=2657482 RepID=UPI00209B3EB7|nr:MULTISPECIES: regulatory protein RecX [unclassified Gordonia (in: high G+C Gram-positive bacteria)]MDF3282019.1 regulatory protein RecX [Gordonia sp. N1V]
MLTGADEPSGATGSSGATGPTAWDVALRLLGVRARSRGEMQERLVRRGFDADTVADVMRRLDSAGLLDDEDFASEWVRSRHTHSGRGRVALRHELKAKGVDAATIENALSDIDPEDERAVAGRLVAKKLTPRVLEQVADRAERDKHFRRLVGMLVRRGYPQSLAIDVVGEHLDAAAE